MKHTTHCIALLAFCLFFLTPSFATNGYFSHGTGIKNKAMAGAGVALPQDALAGATNPAGMAFVGNRFDVGATIFVPDRDYSSSSSIANGGGGAFTVGPNSETSGDNWFLIPSFGINKEISDRTAIGLSLYGNGGLNTTYDGGTAAFAAMPNVPGTFGAGTAGVDLFQIFLNLSIAHKFSENVSVGISPLFVVQGFRANGLENFGGFTKTFVESGTPADNLTSNGQDYSFGGGVQVGALIKNIADVVDFGISYRTKIYMDEFDEYSDLFAEDGDFDVPPTFWAGFAYHPTSNLTLLFDFQRIWYEDVDAVSNDIQNLFSCSPTNVENCLGGDNGGGFGWRDINILKFGLQWEQSKQNIFRLGYSHSDQPIASDQVLFNILAPGVIEDHISAGYTRVLDDKSEISFLLMHALKESVEGANAFDPTQTIELEMQQFEMGVSWSRKF
ncbi:MAG: outer membrane protein transport protein [Gammaproteobacteria bacterium]|nr:outer membrane protein transport protein [Gammaproteobacteria bacterium]